jgi:hypothetical protein
MVTPQHGMTIHLDQWCNDVKYLDVNIRMLMGDIFNPHDQGLINRRTHQHEDMWCNGILTAHQSTFSNSNRFLRENPDCYGKWSYTNDGTQFSDGILTDRNSDSEYRGWNERHFHWSPEEALEKDAQSEYNQAFGRFFDKVRTDLKEIAVTVHKSTQRAKVRWSYLIDSSRPEATERNDLIGKKRYTRYEAIHRKYYSKLTRVLVKRLVRDQLLLYQGRTPSARHPLTKDAKGNVHATSDIFFLLERMLGMPYKQIVKILVHDTRYFLAQLGKEYSSNTESDGPSRSQIVVNLHEISGVVHSQGLDSGYSSWPHCSRV